MSELTNMSNFEQKKTPKQLLLRLENYFEVNSENSRLFIPELEAVKKINEILKNELVSKEDIIQVIQIYNQANESEHYNGTAWWDVIFCIRKLAQEKNFETILLENKNFLLKEI